jgi:hypothetical protein
MDLTINRSGGGQLLLETPHTTIQDGDDLGHIYFGGHDNTLDSPPAHGALIRAEASHDWDNTNSNDAPAELQFFVNDRNTGSGLVQRMTLNEDGYLGIGATAPSKLLHIYGDDASNFVIYAHNDGNNANRYGASITCGLDSPSSAGDCGFIYFNDGDGTARGGIRSSSTPNNPEFFNGSDKRMKKDIAPTNIKGLDSINALTLSEWNWNHPTKVSPKQDIGIVADDLEKVFPELISKGKLAGWDDVATDLKQVPSETKLTFVLIKAVQELSAKVTALENA